MFRKSSFIKFGNKIKNTVVPTFLLGFGTSLLLQTLTLAINRGRLPVFDFQIMLFLPFALSLILYKLFAKKKTYNFRLVIFFSGALLWMVLAQPAEQISLLKLSLYLINPVIAIYLVICTWRWLLYLVNKYVLMGKWYIKLDLPDGHLASKDLGEGLDLPITNFEEINKIRKNVNDDSLFSNFEGVLSNLKSIVVNKRKRRFVKAVCLNGRWGSGKTSLLNLLKESLNKYKPKDSSGHPYNKPIWLEFNPWLYSNQDELVKDFFSDLKATIYENFGIDLEPEVGFVTKTATPSFEGMGLQIPIVNAIPDLFFKSGTSENIKEKLRTKLSGVDRKLVVVLDDVDRIVKPEEIILVIKLAKLISELNGLIVIMAFDYNKVATQIALERKDSDPKFLEKIIKKVCSIHPYTYKELESIFLSDLIENKRLTKVNMDKAKLIFEKFMFEANKRWFTGAESSGNKSKNVVLSPLFERYKGIYLQLSPGGNYAQDYKQKMDVHLRSAISNLIDGSTENMRSLVRDFVRPIQKVTRERLWQNNSEELIAGFAGIGVPREEETFTNLSSFLVERDDLYGQKLYDDIAEQLQKLEDKYSFVDDRRAVFENVRDSFLKKIKNYIDRYEDVKGDDYDFVVSWFAEEITPREVKKLSYDLAEEVGDWDDDAMIDRIVETAAKQLYIYRLEN